MRVQGMDFRDAFYAAVSLAAVLFILLAAAVAAAFLLTLGSPALLIGSILALGFTGLLLLFGVAVAAVSAWYAVYALLASHFGRGAEGAPEKGGFTLGRIRQSE
jgi:hypothetical protein